MHTKSDLYALDKWTTLGEKKPKEKKPALAPAPSAKKATAPALDTKGLNGSNLLTKGVSAAAQLINSYKSDEAEDEDSASEADTSEADTDASEAEDDNILFGGSTKNKLLKGRCFI